jgi:protein SCO1
MSRTAAGCLLFLAALASGGCAWLMEEPRAEPVRADRAPRGPRPSLFAHPWVWNDELGREVSFARWRGRPLVVTAAFTSCRETCPRTMQKLRDVYMTFQRQKRAAQFIVVTLDPGTDTPDRLLAFKREQRLPASWHLLTGPKAQTRELARMLGIHLVDLDGHLMHDGAIVVFDEQGRSRRSYTGWGVDHEAPVL